MFIHPKHPITPSTETGVNDIIDNLSPKIY